MIVVEGGKMKSEVATREFGLVVFVVKDVVLAERFARIVATCRQNPVFPGE